jgi:hypothetical protein
MKNEIRQERFSLTFCKHFAGTHERIGSPFIRLPNHHPLGCFSCTSIISPRLNDIQSPT